MHSLLISCKAIPYKDLCIVLEMNVCHYNATMANTIDDTKFPAPDAYSTVNVSSMMIEAKIFENPNV